VAGHYHWEFSIKMKSKRVLDLEEAEARVSRLRMEVAEEENRSSTYLLGELHAHLLRSTSEHVSEIRIDQHGTVVLWFGAGRNTRLEVRVPNGWMKQKTQFFIGTKPVVMIHEDTCDLLPLSKLNPKHMDLLFRTLPDALRLAQEIIPRWRANPPNAVALMTTRVLRWIAGQLFGTQWSDIVAGHVVPIINHEE
jgi:hypothetical protein